MLLVGATDGSWERRWGIPEWEHRDMTICIAAICESGRTIIVASDREMGGAFTSAEIIDGKWHHLYAGKMWSVGIAGTVSNATDVIAQARRLGVAEAAPTSLDIQDAIGNAYREARLRKAAARFLASRGWTLKEFRETGAKSLPPDVYATIDAQITTFNFDADLIIAGFDEVGPSILTVTNPGVSIDHSKLGFWGIGSGWTAAQMSLFSREYSWNFSSEKAAYFVYEAKRAAERATGVGETTDIHFIRRAEPLIIIPLQSETKKELGKIYNQLAPKPLRPKHEQILKNTNEFDILRKTTSDLRLVSAGQSF